jgi:hypothetical protein
VLKLKRNSGWRIGVAGLLIAFAGWLWLTAEPSWSGHGLSEWIELYGAVYSGQVYSTNIWATKEETEDTIRHMGNRAIPDLVRWIQLEPRHHALPGSSALMDFLWVRTPSWMRPSIRKWRFDDRPLYRANGAVYAFGVLGTNANRAIPILVSVAMLTNDVPWENLDPARGPEYDDLPNRRAVFALANIGPGALPTLLALATNRSMNIRCDAVHLLSCMGTNALPTLPLLLQIIKEPTNRVAAIAARTLGILKLEPGTVIPALTNALESHKIVLREKANDKLDPRMVFQYEAFRAIARYGRDARGGLPAIIRWLDDEDPLIPCWAADALGETRVEPRLVVPALTKSLETPNPYLVRSAARALEAYGSESASAVPTLIQVARRTGLMYPARGAVQRTLTRITNAVANAESKAPNP